MKNNNNLMIKYKRYFFPLALAVILGLILYFILIPFVKKLEEKSNKIQSRLIDLEIEKDKINELPKIKEQFELVEGNKQKMEKALFSEQDILGLVQEIEKIAGETNNEISISVEDDKNNSKKNKVKTEEEEKSEKITDPFEEKDYFKMNIDLLGDYNSLIKFMDRLSRVSYYNSIIGFNIAYYEEEEIAKPLININKENEDGQKKEEITVEDEKRPNIKSSLEIIFYLNSIK